MRFVLILWALAALLTLGVCAAVRALQGLGAKQVLVLAHTLHDALVGLGVGLVLVVISFGALRQLEGR